MKASPPLLSSLRPNWILFDRRHEYRCIPRQSFQGNDQHPLDASINMGVGAPAYDIWLLDDKANGRRTQIKVFIEAFGGLWSENE